MIPTSKGPAIFHIVIFELGDWKLSISYSTFGLAFIFDEGKLELIVFNLLISYRRPDESGPDNKAS